MSSGGKYIIEAMIASQSPQDRILLNYKLLQNQLEKRCKNLPFFASIDTHTSYIKKYYKPIMPIANEWREELADLSTFGYGVNRFSLATYGTFTCEIILQIELRGLSVVNPLDRCGYYDFLGHKMIKTVWLDMAGIEIDRYTQDAYNVYYNYFVSEDKRTAYMRAVGQETPDYVYVQQDVNDAYRIKQEVVYGPQTPKQTHDVVLMNIPIIFDFCLRPEASIFSGKIPFGQKYLHIEIANPSEFVYVQNLGGGGNVNMPSISGKIIVNNIFLDPAVERALKPNVWRSTVRVFKEETFETSLADIKRLDQLRYNIERLYFGIRPNTNTGPTNWWRFHNITNIPAVFPVRIPGAPNQLAFRNVNIEQAGNCLLTAKFLTKNVEIIRQQNYLFYSTMQPLYKGFAPHDSGMMMYCFARDTYTNELTSFYNVSNEREFYIDYTAQVSGQMYILSYCINWIEITESGAVYVKFKT